MNLRRKYRILLNKIILGFTHRKNKFKFDTKKDIVDKFELKGKMINTVKESLIFKIKNKEIPNKKRFIIKALPKIVENCKIKTADFERILRENQMPIL